MKISEYDKNNIGKILEGQGTWFGACLIRLIAKADHENKELLRQIYPSYVEAYLDWMYSPSNQ